MNFSFWEPLVAFATIGLAGCSLVHLPNAGASAPEPIAVHDDGFYGPMHRAHAGEIVLTTKPIDRSEADESLLVTKIDLTRPVYGRLFFKTSFTNAFTAAKLSCPRHGGGSSVTPEKIDVYAAEKGAPRTKWVLLDETDATGPGRDTMTSMSLGQKTDAVIGEKTTWPTHFAKPAFRFAELLDRLPHQDDATFELHAIAVCYDEPEWNETELATGQFSIATTPADVAKYHLTYGPALSQGEFTHAREIPDFKAAASKAYAPARVVDIQVLSRDWQVQRNNLGVVLSRSVSAAVWVHEKNGCRLRGTQLVEASLGGGTFVKTPSFNAADEAMPYDTLIHCP